MCEFAKLFAIVLPCFGAQRVRLHNSKFRIGTYDGV